MSWLKRAEPGSLDAARAREIALQRLSTRETSSADLRTYLVRKGALEEDARKIVDELRERRYLDDERYGRVLVRDQVLKKRGPGMIALKLKQKGVPMERARLVELIAQFETEERLPSQEEIARAFVERRYSGFREDRKEATRALQALLRRGFGYDLARKIIRSD